MPITNESINEHDLDRARLTLRVHAVMQRARRVIPRNGPLRVPGFETRVERRAAGRCVLGAYLYRDGDSYHVELCRDPYACGETRVTAYEARVVIASRGNWRIGLDLLPMPELAEPGVTVDHAALQRLQSALECVFGVAGADACYLSDAIEPEVRATLAGEG